MYIKVFNVQIVGALHFSACKTLLNCFEGTFVISRTLIFKNACGQSLVSAHAMRNKYIIIKVELLNRGHNQKNQGCYGQGKMSGK